MLENSVLTGIDAFDTNAATTTGRQTNEAADGDGKALSFTFWDETEETTQGTDSQKAVVLVKGFSYDLTDGKSPTVVVNPFYWKGLNSNSIYDSGEKTGDSYSVSSISELQGHIELESDWKETDAYKNNEAETDSTKKNSVYDGDPKVSGKITFTGTAYDEHSLSKITFTFGDKFTNEELAHYDTATSAWVKSDAKMADDGYEVTIEEAEKDSKGNSASYGVYEDTAFFGQKGHKVYWTLSINTAKITKIADKDVTLTVIAEDLAANKTKTSGKNAADEDEVQAPTKSAGYIPGQELSTTVNYTVTDGTTNYPIYKMDVVPYITSVVTKLAGNDKTNPEIYSRTARGHYPISSSENSVTLKGFNLAEDNADFTLNETTISGLTTREYVHTVNSIESINNKNNNGSHGAYNVSVEGLAEKTKVANMYNRQPNNTTNLTLTDDVYFDIWEFKDGAQGNKGKIKEPIMRINPSNNVVGFAFASGPAHFCMPSQTNSFELWQKNYADYNGIAMAYDYSGYAHTIAVGLDTEPNSNYAGRMNYTNSAFGHKGRGGNNNDADYKDQSYGNFQRRTQVALDSIGGAGTLDQERFSDVSIATASAESGFPRVYIAYCDTNSEQIRFRYGEINALTRSTGNGTASFNQFGQINDSKKKGSEDPVSDDTNNSYNLHGAFDAHADYYSLIAGGSTGNVSGEYVSIDAIPGTGINTDVVVVVWYDGTNLNYMYRYGTKDDTDASSDAVANKWSKPKVIFEDAGAYCKIKADSVGGIHIACFDEINSDLKYAYMPGYNSETIYKATVDSYSQIGSNLELDVGRKTATGNVIPYISYYAEGMRSMPKFAYLPDGINKTTPIVPNGADTDTNLFTGSWEVSLLPTTSKVRNDNIQIAVWKNRANGVINYTPVSTATAVAPTADGSTIKPNGTSEVVVGYAITKGSIGYIETAMRK